MQPSGPGFVYVADVEREIPLEGRRLLDGRPRRVLSVALRTADAVIGFISVDNLISGRSLSPADAPPLVAFANALAVAVENVALLEERKHRIDFLDADLRRLEEQLTWLQSVGERLERPQDIDGLLDAVYVCVREGLGYDRVGIALIEADAAGRSWVREVRGTDEHGQPNLGVSETFALDDPALPKHSPDLNHLLEHSFYYCPDRWAITPEEYRRDLEGRMGEQLAVALRHDGTLLGVISVDNLLTGRPITEDDASPLIAFAGQAALAISRARLWAEHEAQGLGLARRVSELEWLRDVSRRVSAATTLDEVLDVVYDGIRDGLGYDRVGINLFDRDTAIFDEVRGTDEDGRKLGRSGRGVRLDHDSPIWEFPGIATVLHGGDFYYSADATAETPPHLVHLFDGAPRHNIMVPLRSGDLVIGMISVDNLLSGRPISREDAGPLLALANQVGTAMENARLRERERAERARLEVLLENARTLNSTLEGDLIPQELTARLVTALDAIGADFTAVDFKSRTCGVIANYSAPGHQMPIDDSVWDPLDNYPRVEYVLNTRQPLCWHVDDPGYPESERAYLRQFNAQAELLIPVVVKGEAATILEIYWDRPINISPDTVALCTAVAEQAAVALERARLYADAAARAELDALTGLLHHRALQQQIDLFVAAATPFALLLLDVDNFKLFNDTYGHPTGDGVLSQVAVRLREACREGDVAARYGGDEFALLLRGAGAEEAAGVAQRVSAMVRANPHVNADGTFIPLSISAGVACFPHDGQTRQELVVVADQAMYAAKRGGSTHQVARRGHGPMRSRQAADLLGDSPFGVLDGLVNAVDAKDRYTREHSEDVTRIALSLARAIGLGESEQHVLAVACPIHDVGKIAVPDRILRKPGRLMPEEYAVIKRHVAYGVAIIGGVLDDPAVTEAVAYHHERWDGTGYPNGLEGPGTPLLGRVMQVADAVSAMTVDRPYRQALTWEQVVKELRAAAGSQFDPHLVEIFVDAFSAAKSARAS